ncbi:MAG: hypothetical protein O9327_04965 [Polaromonas sp.]|jgi:hypothetical protein|nr:hypothetical protein [Polaromonas sp.]
MTATHGRRSTASSPTKANLATKLRESLVLSDADLVGVANETIASMNPVVAETFRQRLAKAKAFQSAIRLTTIDVGLVLALAKSLASDEEFNDSASLMHEVQLGAHDGMVGTYAIAMVKLDLDQAKRMASGEIPDDDALLYRLIPIESVVKRLNLLLACLDALKAQMKAEPNRDHVAA